MLDQWKFVEFFIYHNNAGACHHTSLERKIVTSMAAFANSSYNMYMILWLRLVTLVCPGLW